MNNSLELALTILLFLAECLGGWVSRLQLAIAYRQCFVDLSRLLNTTILGAGHPSCIVELRVLVFMRVS